MSPVLSDASGAAAIQQGWQHIVFGDADVAVCGGVEARIEAVPLATFSALDMLSANNADPEGASRPFDKNRDGMVLGEGGAMMLLETEEHAKARGADILARVLGAAVKYDAYHDVAPEPDGEMQGEAIARAINQAGLTPTDIDHVNASAAGTVYGDLDRGAGHPHMPWEGTRPRSMHPKPRSVTRWARPGPIEAVLTVQTLRDGISPPTLNVTELDPEIDLDVIAGESRRSDYRYAVSNSFAVGGHNAAIVFAAY